MATYIPYLHRGVGEALDLTKQEFESDLETSASLERCPWTWEHNPQVETRCCLVKDIKDVCDLLDIVPELALKAMIGQLNNLPITEIVKDLYNENVVTVAFRVRLCIMSEKMPDWDDENTVAKSVAHNVDRLAKVTSKLWGNELITVFKLSSFSQDVDVLENASNQEVLEMILDEDNIVNDNKFKKIEEKWAKKVDDKVNGKKATSDLSMKIKYFSFLPVHQKMKDTVTDMMKTIDMFRRRFQQVIEGCQPKSESVVDLDPNPIAPSGDQNPSATSHTVAGSPLCSPQGDVAKQTLFNLGVGVWLQQGPQVDQLEDICNIPEKLLKVKLTGQKAQTSIEQLIDARIAVIRAGKDDYGIAMRQQQLDDRLTEMNHCIQQTGLDHGWDEHVERLTDQDLAQQSMKLFHGFDLDVVLLGKTGHGKSSLGNSILMKPIFLTSGSPVSETSDNMSQDVEIDGRKISVVDTPGLYDTRFDIFKMKKKAIQFLVDMIKIKPNGYHALILVLRYGDRVTEEERNTITLLKRAFGEDVVKTHVVFVITAGDVFEEMQPVDFDLWIRNTGSEYLDELLAECQHRCVLFDYRTKDPEKMKRQVLRLVSMVETIGSRYTNEMFQSTKASRDQIYAEAMAPKRKKQIDDYLDMVLPEVEAGRELDNNTLSTLEKLKKQAQELSSEDWKTIERQIDNIFRTNEVSKRKKAIKSQLDPIKDLVSQGKEMDQGQLQELDNVLEDLTGLPSDDQPMIKSLVKSLQDNNISNKETRLRKEKEKKNMELKKEIRGCLNDIYNEVNSGQMVDEEREKMLNNCLERAKSLPEEEYEMFCRLVKSIKDTSDQTEKDQLSGEIMQDLYDMHAVVNDGNYLDQDTQHRLGNYLKTEDKLTKDDYNRIRKLIEDIQKVEKKIRDSEALKKEIMEDLGLAKSIVAEDQELDADKLEKLNNHLKRAMQLGGEDYEQIKETINNVINCNKSIKDTKKKTEIIKSISELVKKGQLMEKQERDKLIKDAKQLPDDYFDEIMKKLNEIKEKAAAEASNAAGDDKKYRSKLYNKESKNNVKKKDCFSGCCVVQARSGRDVRMADLKTGDQVMCQDGCGNLFYDTVYMFGHREKDVVEQFVVIETDKHRVAMTRNHFVCSFRDGTETFVSAGTIKPGDAVLVAGGHRAYQTLERERVVRVSQESKRGLYAPFTKSGTMVVDGVLASCYMNILDHKTCHKALWPLRKLYDISPSALAFVNGKDACIPLIPRIVRKMILLTRRNQENDSKIVRNQ